MAVAFDAVTENERTDTSDPWTWTHTPVGTPKGVVVALTHGVTGNNLVNSVTYGGVAMRWITGARDFAGEMGQTELWFLGNQIPTGAQTVSVDLTSATTTDIHGVSFTVTASDDTAVIDFNGLDEDAANPTVTIEKQGRTGISFASLYTGTDAPGGTLATGNTLGPTMDQGSWSSQTCYETTVDSASHTIGWSTLASDDVAFAALCISEVVQHKTVAYDWNDDGGFAETGTPNNGEFDQGQGTAFIVSLALTGTTDPTIVKPTGWDQIGSTIVNSSGAGIVLATYIYYCTGSLDDIPTNWTWTGARDWNSTWTFVSGLDPDSYIVASSTSATGTGTLLSVTSNTPSVASSLLFATAAVNTSTNMLWTRGGFNYINDNLWNWDVAHFAQETTSAVARTFTQPFSSSAPWAAQTFALRTKTTGIAFRDIWGTTTTDTSITRILSPWNTSFVGWEKDDLAVAWVTTEGSDPTFVTPSGWTKVGNTVVNTAGAVDLAGAMYYKILTQADLGTSPSFSWTGSRKAALTFHQYRGTILSSVLDSPVTADATGNSSSPTVTAATMNHYKETLFIGAFGFDTTSVAAVDQSYDDGFIYNTGNTLSPVETKVIGSIASTGRTAAPGFDLSGTAQWIGKVAAFRGTSLVESAVYGEATLLLALVNSIEVIGTAENFAPSNTGEPEISGVTFAGTQVSVDEGTWTGDPDSFTYQWQVSSDGVSNWTDIPGATNTSLVIPLDYEGMYIRCGVTAYNEAGASS